MCAFLCTLRKIHLNICVSVCVCTHVHVHAHVLRKIHLNTGGASHGEAEERAEHQQFPPCPFTMDRMWLAFLSQQKANYSLISRCNGLFVFTQVCRNEQKWAEKLWNHYGKRQPGTTVWWMAAVYSRKKATLRRQLRGHWLLAGGGGGSKTERGRNRWSFS